MSARRVWFVLLVLLPAPAWAAGQLSPGGAAQTVDEPALFGANAVASPGLKLGGLKLGGMTSWGPEDGSLVASVTGQGGLAAGLTAGSAPNEAGTHYDMRVSLNPARPGLAETGDMAMTVSISHDLTPNLSLIGSAEARHPIAGTEADHFQLGAGLGVRF